MSAAASQLYTLIRIGTSRAQGGAPGAASALAPELAAVLPPADSAEQGLWLALGAHSLWTRAGRQPLPNMPSAPSTVAVPADTQPPSSAAAEALLARLLNTRQDQRLIGEWLRGLQRQGARLPARMLPDLLALATRQAALRPGVIAVLGERGRWLARQQADWQWAFAAATPEERLALWETGTREQRRTALASWRAQDPAPAREALAQAWASEAPEQRAELLACLATGLGPDDEAFLETALDDRRKEVRTAAQALLVRLPQSQLVQRMRSRAEPLLGGAGIEVTLPEAAAKDWKRDGVGANAHPGLGEKAGWLADLLSAVDPRVWTRRFGMTPAQCLTAAQRGEFGHALIRGWIAAVVSIDVKPHELADWIEALVALWLGGVEPVRNQYPSDFFDLFGRMDGAGLHALLARLLAGHDGSGEREQRLLLLIARAAERSTGNWPAALSHDTAAFLLGGLAGQSRSAWFVGEALDALAHAVAPAAILPLEAQWRAAGTEQTPDKRIAAFFDTVRLRHALSLSFQEPA